MADHETLPATVPWSREVVEEIADDIGDAVLAHMQIMYPSTIQAAQSTFKILAAVGVNDARQAIARIRERKRVRRTTRAGFRRMRSARAAPRMSKARIDPPGAVARSHSKQRA